MIATYRLQLGGAFGFVQAADRVLDLKKLGISHLYLSPVLDAATGSAHGYDVVNHARFDDVLDEATSRACRTDPELSRVGEDHMVEIPQRAFRQPGRPLHGSGPLEPVLARMVAVGRVGMSTRVGPTVLA